MHWHFEPSVVAGLLLLTVGYLAAVGPLRSRFAGSAPVSLARQVTYLAGVAALVAALVSPLDHLAEEYLFSAHMVQHLLLTLVGIPLLLLGVPGWLVRPALRPPGALKLARALTSPVTAFLLFNGVFALWHWPALYDLALEREPIHAFEHLTFLATAVLFWWPVLGPLPEPPRLSYPLQMLYLFLASLVSGALGALITLQPDVVYSFYRDAPLAWGLSPLDDQRLGGLIMWVGAMTYFLFAIGAVFIVWAGHDEADAAAEEASYSRIG